MGTLEEARAVLSSEEYAGARARVAQWRRELSKCGKKRANEIQGEVLRHFGEMQRKNPGLYAYFQSEHKELIGAAIKRATGVDVIVD